MKALLPMICRGECQHSRPQVRLLCLSLGTCALALAAHRSASKELTSAQVAGVLGHPVPADDVPMSGTAHRRKAGFRESNA